MRALLILLVLTSCGGASLDPGLGAWLRVSGAQFERGPLPLPANGPAVLALNVSRNSVAQGDTALHLSGTLSPTGSAAAVYLEGDLGFWVLPAGLPEVTVPNAPTFAASAGLARDAPMGRRALLVMAVSSDGTAGPLSMAALDITARPRPTGELVVSLSWDSDADLDLHVVDGNGIEIWARNPNSWKPIAGGPPDPNAWRQGGILDVDSNGQCLIDGRDQENVVWQAPPPSGHYVVRVDTFSLCTASVAHWNVAVELRGQRLAAAAGTATAASSRPPHDLGAGVLALEFDVP